MRDWRLRLVYLVCTGVVLVLGLESRRARASLPGFVAEFSGDTLWALMVFLGLGILIPRTSTLRRAGIALAAAYLIELSQLYHAPWIDAIRRTTLGGLVLGCGFLGTDLVCYTVGIAAGAGLDWAVVRRRTTSSREREGAES